VVTQELQSQIDRYIIRRVLGTGAMGSVYAAWDPKLHREVALKLVPARLSAEPKGRERFSREARAIAAVRHPNIVEIYDYSGVDSPHLFLVIEKLDGQDLYATLHRNGTMGEAVAAAIGHELCLALQVLHEAGIIHRDLKPENVFLNQNGRVVLTDFGIVKAVRDDAAVEGYKESTDVIGTPGFMAPELMSGRGLGPTTDIFALGVLLYNLTTRRLPFEGNTPLDIFKAAAAGRYIDPRKFAPTLSSEFCEIIHACLQPNARKRPRSAEVVRQSLKGVIEELGAVDVRDDLHDYSKSSQAFAQFAQKRAVRRVLSHVKVAAKDHDAEAVVRHRRRLQVLDPFNEEIAEVSGIMDVASLSGQPKRFARFANRFGGKVQTLVHTGVYSLQQVHNALPRGAFLLAGLLMFVGGAGIYLHARSQQFLPDAPRAALYAARTVPSPGPQALPNSSPHGQAMAQLQGAGLPADTGAQLYGGRPQPRYFPGSSVAASNPAPVAPHRVPLKFAAPTVLSAAQALPARLAVRMVGGQTALRIDGHPLVAAAASVRRQGALLPAGRHLLDVVFKGKHRRNWLQLVAGKKLLVQVDVRRHRVSWR
jgi:serine/threonine protein kinase